MITKSNIFSVSIISELTPMTFIGLFGFKSGRKIDKFAKILFLEGETGCPVVIENTLSTMEAKVIKNVEIGTHTIFIGDVINSNVLKKGTPMTYEYYHTVLKGKTSKNSPTFANNNF